MKTDMETILEHASRAYQAAEPGPDCPTMSELCDYFYEDLSPEKSSGVQAHLKSCETCGMALMKIETEATGWGFLAQEISEKALEKAETASAPSISERFAGLVSALADEAVEWLSPLWEPEWGTAMTNEAQEREFEMGGGEFINLSCYWQGAGAGSPAFIHLEWSANILSSSRLWVRFSDPETHELLYEELLGEELRGERDFDADDLSFDPARRRWAVSVVVEAG